MDTTLVAEQLNESRAAPARHRLVEHSLLALAAITVLGLALRLWNLGRKPFWYDEAVLYWIAEAGWADLLARNAAGNSAPPLFAALVIAASSLTTREDGLRLIPLLFGVLTIPAVYWAARAIVRAELALASAFITSIAPTAVLYSQYLREYSLAMLLAAILVGAGARYLAHGSRRDWLIVMAGSALALQCQYGLVVVVAGIGLGCLVRATRAGRARGELPRLVIFGLVVFGAALLAWWTALGAQFQLGGWGATAYLRPYYWDGSLGGLVPFLTSRLFRLLAMPFHAYPPSLAESLPAALVAGAGLGMATIRPAWRPLAVLTLASIGLTAAGAVLRLYPLGPIRQDAFLLSPLYATAPLAVVGAVRLLERLRAPAPARIAAVLAIGFVLVVRLRTVETVTFRGWEDMRALVDRIERHRLPDDALIVDPAAAPQFRYYYRPRPDDGGGVFTDPDDPRGDRLLAAIGQAEGRVLLVTLAWAETNGQLLDGIGTRRPVRVLEDETGARLYLIDPKTPGR